MNYAELQAQINAANAKYASGDVNQMREAVAQRDAAVAAYQASLSKPAPSAPAGPPPPPPPPPKPPLPTFTRMQAPDKNIKPAPSDIIQFDDSSVEIALIQDLLFEDIGATELANISRTDLIDGQSVIYSPIKNLPSVRQEFNPNNIIATAYATDYFSRFGIDLIAKGVNEPYFDADGNLIIEVDTLAGNEEIQVQILSSGTIDLIEEL